MMDALAGSGTMGIMALLCVLLFIVLILAAIALVKYLFFGGRHTSQNRF